MLHRTLPQTPGEKAAIARSRQLTEFRWTPIRDVSTYLKSVGQTVLPAGVEIKGFPYASTGLTKRNRFIAADVSFESFISAIGNPESQIYQPGRATLNACNFGIVCNGLVRYAYGIDVRYTCLYWHLITGIEMIKPVDEYTVDDLKICDSLLTITEKRKHVVLVTDILRDDDGNVAEVEISEAVRPSCKRESYPVEQFYEKYKGYSLWRYTKLDEVPPVDEDVARLIDNYKGGVTPKIAVDNGARSNYLEGEEVILSVNSDRNDTLEIIKDGEVVKTYKVAPRAFFPITPDRGYYTARLAEAGDSVDFCVCKAEMHSERHGDEVVIVAEPCDEKSEIVYADFRYTDVDGVGKRCYEMLSKEEKAARTFTRTLPSGTSGFKIYFKNEYGIWCHDWASVD